MLRQERSFKYAALYERFRAAAPDFGFRDDVVRNDMEFESLFQLFREGPPISVMDVLTKLAAATNQVCEISDSTGHLGTGFLVGPDLVLTASHVLPGDDFTDVECAFNNITFGVGVVESNDATVVGIDGLADRSDLAVNHPVTTSALDFRLFHLKMAVGGPVRKFIKIAPTTVAKDDSVYVVEYHQGTRAVSFSGGTVPQAFNGATQPAFRHNAWTSSGASGAPVFNNHFDVVGLHRGKVPGSSDNEAIAISFIFKHMHDQNLI